MRPIFDHLIFQKNFLSSFQEDDDKDDDGEEKWKKETSIKHFFVQSTCEGHYTKMDFELTDCEHETTAKTFKMCNTKNKHCNLFFI